VESRVINLDNSFINIMIKKAKSAGITVAFGVDLDD